MAAISNSSNLGRRSRWCFGHRRWKKIFSVIIKNLMYPNLTLIASSFKTCKSTDARQMISRFYLTSRMEANLIKAIMFCQKVIRSQIQNICGKFRGKIKIINNLTKYLMIWNRRLKFQDNHWIKKASLKTFLNAEMKMRWFLISLVPLRHSKEFLLNGTRLSKSETLTPKGLSCTSNACTKVVIASSKNRAI